MPNGKPGDHWYTDVTDHRLPTFSPEIDGLIRKLDGDAAGDRPYTPWDDPRRQELENIVDAFLDEVGRDKLAARSETVGMDYRELSEGERVTLLARLKALDQAE